MNYSLVVMAAGLGSRFGGVKQLAKVGKSGQAFLDFSISDALAAGFSDVVLIVRSEIEEDVRQHISSQHENLSVRYALQDSFGPKRDKPWGTVHAVLSAKDFIDNPFAVINADDYYGPSSFKLAFEALQESKPGVACNVAFELGKTVPPKGFVTRAVTEVSDNVLTQIVETEECGRLADGSLSADGKPVAEDTPVSMNLLCFDDSILADLQAQWETFYAENADDPKAEVQLPTAIGELMKTGQLSVNVVPSSEQWIGITNPEDFELAKEALSDR